MTVGTGRYAPSPSGPLHVGNLRTAVAAWAWARSTDRRFLLRIEDIDPHRTGAAQQQVEDMRELGIDWDDDPIIQTSRFEVYNQILEDLANRDQLFECYCSRKDIAEATRAPHAPQGHYPGTCANLTESERAEGRKKLRQAGREPALRLRPPTKEWSVNDLLWGEYRGPVDAFVLQRGDGTPAYNLACVVDDAHSGVDQVIRGADLLPTSPGQAYLTHLLGFSAPTYGHVPLVVNREGARLAKRDGAVTLRDLRDLGWETEHLLEQISVSLGTPPRSSVTTFLDVFSPADIPLVPYEFAVTSGLRAHRPG